MRPLHGVAHAATRPGRPPAAFWRERAALVQADDDIDAALLQVERVGVALAAVAQDGDRLALQPLRIAISLVVERRH